MGRRRGDGNAVTDENLIGAARILYGTGDFERVDVHAEIEQGRRFVVIDVDEKPWGPNYLRIGGRAVSDFQTDARFSVTLQHTHTWMNRWGAEWRSEVQIGDIRRFMTSFSSRSGGERVVRRAIVEALQSNSDIFGLGNRRTDRITNAVTSISGALGGASAPRA